jgi:hypothetical protein
MLTFGAGGQFQDGWAAGIVGQHDRHAAGTEVQHDEEPLVELAFEAEDVWRRADQALRPGLQRGFARAQVDQPADERERRPRDRAAAMPRRGIRRRRRPAARAPRW